MPTVCLHRLSSAAAVAAVTTLTLAIPCAGSSFIASLHSNFVVNVDFEGSAQSANSAGSDVQDEQVVAFAGGKKKFSCKLPTSRNRTSENKVPDDSKFKAYFRNAKLSSYKGRCWKIAQDYWSYDVCFGRKIAQFRPDTDVKFSLGEHLQEADELLPDGGVVEHFAGGTDNRSTVIRYVCGSSESSRRIFKIEEGPALKYTVTVTGPSFCSWSENKGTQSRDQAGNVLQIASLLEELRGSCVNVTQGWWTYEYCFPHTLRQFHAAPNGKKRDPEHALGTVNGTDAPTGIDEVNMTLTKVKPSMAGKDRHAPPATLWALRQFLGGGAVCDETKRPRAAALLFQCPSSWQSHLDTRIASINEGSLCEYEVVMHSALLCGHRRFIPALPRGKEVIQCTTM